MMVQEHDKMMKRTKEEKLKGEKRSYIENIFGGYYLNTGNNPLSLIYSALPGLHACVKSERPRAGPFGHHFLQKCEH
jgi:hypothetical protein